MKFKKIFSRIHRKMIFIYDGVNTKKYMKKYNKWLKKEGMDIDGNVKYIHHTAFLDGISYKDIHIGNNSVISLDCIVLIHDFSVEAGFCAIGKQSKEGEAYFIKPVYIGNNCFIGAKSIILPGTTLGDNCIVGAGSVLTGKKYPSGSIIAGNPAKVIAQVDDWANKKFNENKYFTGGF